MSDASESNGLLKKLNTNGFSPAFILALVIAVGGALSTYSVIGFRVTAAEVRLKASEDESKDFKKILETSMSKFTESVNNMSVDLAILKNNTQELKIQLTERDKSNNELKNKLEDLTKKVMENQIEITVLKRSMTIEAVRNPR